MDIAKKTTTTLDGFDGFVDRVEGDEQKQTSGRVIQGRKLGFTGDGKWVDSNDEEIPSTCEFTVVDIARVVQKWINNKPVETNFIPHGEPIPDIEKLNEACPKSEWSEDFNGNPRGPYQFQFIMYGVDKDMGKVSYPTGTTGGAICIGELRDKVVNMRKFRGAHVYPVVRLSHAWMNTKFGGRNRPAFEVVRWIAFGDEGPVSLEEPENLPPSNGGGAHVVPDVTLREEVKDEIPF
jgi:hypothetical protein